MTWFNKDFKRRMPLMINTSLLAGGASIQANITIPAEWDDFWNNVIDTGGTSGYDVVITDEKGLQLPFQRVTWTPATRTGVFRANHSTAKASNVIHFLFVYWNNPDQSVDLSSVVGAIGTAVPAFGYLGAPYKNIVNLGSNQGLSTTPTTIIQKDPDEKIDVWFPVSQLLAPRTTPYNERLDFKSIEYLDAEVLNNSGVNQAGMYALSETRIIAGWIKLRIQQGVDNNDYVIRAKIHTSDLELYILTCLLQVRKLLPT